MTPADPLTAARNPLTDPQPGDIVEIQPSLFRQVCNRSPRMVWFHSRTGPHWFLPTYCDTLKDWQEAAKNGKVIEMAKEEVANG